METKYLNENYPSYKSFVNYIKNYSSLSNEIDTLSSKPPELIEIILNNRCNFKCEMCHIWKSTNIDTFPIKKLMKLIDDISIFKNKLTIQFLGGETLLYKDLNKAIEYASNKNIRTSITTNGSLLSKQKVIELSKSNLTNINISLDSINEKVHNDLRGNNNSFKKIMKALSYFEKYDNKINVGINTIISNKNLEGLFDLSKFTHKTKRINSHYFIALEKPYCSNTNDNWMYSSKFKFLWPNNKTIIKNTFNKLILDMKTNYKITNSESQFKNYMSYYLDPKKFIKRQGCKFGEDHLLINHNGDVSLCSSKKEFSDFININKANIYDIWRSKKASNIRHEMKKCQKNCAQILSCVYKDENKQI